MTQFTRRAIIATFIELLNERPPFLRSRSAGLTVADGDVQLIADFYTYALVGQVLEWLNHGMKTDQEQVIERAAVLFDGSIRRALEHADPRHAASENRA